MLIPGQVLVKPRIRAVQMLIFNGDESRARCIVHQKDYDYTELQEFIVEGEVYVGCPKCFEDDDQKVEARMKLCASCEVNPASQKCSVCRGGVCAYCLNNYGEKICDKCAEVAEVPVG